MAQKCKPSFVPTPKKGCSRVRSTLLQSTSGVLGSSSVYTRVGRGTSDCRQERQIHEWRVPHRVQVVPILVAPDSLEAVYSKDIFKTALTDEKHFKRVQLVLCPRTGDPCKVIPYPTVDGNKYPHGAILDTDSCPLWTVNPLCLKQYLQVCGCLWMHNHTHAHTHVRTHAHA